MKIKQIGIDIGKNTFHLIGLGVDGNIVLRRQFTRSRLVTFFEEHALSISTLLLKPVQVRTGWRISS